MTDSTKPRVRIAPSPTGDPHVGTGYMALFNLAFARRNGGTFIVRIEDTDRVRYDADSEHRIIEALQWLGLTWDEGPGVDGDYGPYRQSSRLEIYREHLDRLVASGHAYPCFCTKDRLEELRAAQKADKAQQGYDGLCRAIPPEEAAARVRTGVNHVFRLKVDPGGTSRWADIVRGDLEFENAGIDDQVLMKADGFPTYHLANVVDDRLMGITHVIRGEEWISSTPKHLMLYDCFGWEPPRFAHMPLLRRPGGAKISKRKDPTNVLWFRDQGFLPEALRNFLGNMGFSLSGDREIYDLETMFREFDFARVKPRGPEFDMAKLEWMNGEYIRALEHDDLVSRASGFMARIAADVDRFQPVPASDWSQASKQAEKDRLQDEDRRREILRRVAHLHTLHTARPDVLPRARPHVQERLKTWADLPSQLTFFYEELDYDAAELIPKKGTLESVGAVLSELDQTFRAIGDAEWTTAVLDERGREAAGRCGLKVGDVFTTLRVATTCSRVSPPLFQSMEILGREECLRRIQRAQKMVRAPV